MSGRSPPLYCTLILISMHSHQSYPNITTVIHSYESIVLLSIIVPSRHTGIGLWVNGKLYTISILYNIIKCHARENFFCHFYNTMLDGVLHYLCFVFTKECSEGLSVFRFFFKYHVVALYLQPIFSQDHVYIYKYLEIPFIDTHPILW